MSGGRIVFLVVVANVATAACLFPSFDGFHESGATDSTSQSGASSGAGAHTGSSSSAMGGGGSNGGHDGGPGGDAGTTDPCYLGDDPVAVWPLDDGQGKTARECRGLYPGVISEVTSWVDGPPGFAHALFFGDAADDLHQGLGLVTPKAAFALEVGGHDTEEGKPFSVALWFHRPIILDNPDNPQGQFPVPPVMVSRACWNFVIAGGDRPDAGTDYGIELGMRLGFGGTPVLLSNAAANLDAWTHAAVTYAGGTTFKFYRNGMLYTTVPFEAGKYTPTNEAITLGSRGGDKPFYGGLAGVRLYDRELGVNEVAALVKKP